MYISIWGGCQYYWVAGFLKENHEVKWEYLDKL